MEPLFGLPSHRKKSRAVRKCQAGLRETAPERRGEKRKMEHKSPSPFVVMKFGGTSVKDRASWETIAKTTQRRLHDGESPVVVCSALAGVSNELVALVREPEIGRASCRERVCVGV